MPLNSHLASRLENGWFTVEPIDDQTFAISEYGQWMKVHAYLVVGDHKAALLDTGLGVGNIQAIVGSLTSLPVEVLTTHAHWDHTGGHLLFKDFSVHESEREWIEGGFDDRPELIRGYLVREPFTKEPPVEFELERFRPVKCPVKRLHQDGDFVELGGRTLEVLHTPGHSPGHVCVYEAATGYLATADLLYAGMLLAGLQFSDPQAFRRSLERLASLPKVERLLPGHGRLAIDPSLLEEAVDAFRKLDHEGYLKKGGGLHRFKNLKVRL